MKVKGVRLYGVKDIRLEEFEIPEIAEDEILLKIECNGIAVSTLKEITLAQRHLRVPKNIKKNPVLIGHEFSGTIAKVGTRWKEDYQEGKQFVLVPEIPHQIESPGYSYPYFGGAATYCIIPADVIEKGCLLQYEADSFYELAQAQALYSIVGSFHSNYHSKEEPTIIYLELKKVGIPSSLRSRSHGTNGNPLCPWNEEKAKKTRDHRYESRAFGKSKENDTDAGRNQAWNRALLYQSIDVYRLRSSVTGNNQ